MAINFEMFYRKAIAAMRIYVEQQAIQLERYMKINAPWTNRTGNARQALSAKVSDGNGYFLITLAHGPHIYYGIYLELAHEKRFAILQPTVRSQGPKVMKAFNKFIDKL